MRTLTKLFAMIAAGLLALMGMSVASAQPSSLIDASRTGTLIIHKSAGDPLTQYGDPTNPNADLSRDPIAGIDFQIQRINDIDLSNNEDWQKLASTDISDYYADGSRTNVLGEPIVATTGEDGAATFSDLPLGAYLVSESPTSAGRKNLSVAAPFVVTVPMTNPENQKEWLYTVEVNAKDQTLTANKATSKTCAAHGDEVKFAISALLPAPDRQGRINRAEIADPLAAEFTYLDGTSEAVVGTTTLTSDDYRIVVNNNVVNFQLSKSGLEKAAEQRLGNPEAVLTWSFKVKVTGTNIAPGTRIENRGYFLAEGYPAFDAAQHPGVPTNRVRVRIGNCEPTSSEIPTPVPDPGTTPTTPVVPGDGSDGTIGGSGSSGSGSSGSSSRGGGLASTGANVIWAAVIGSGLMILGFYLIARRKRS
ncbi:SpaH/EbpB family LPXTG-anchored major pilin [Corynebacterium pseudopelargi]|uniref:Fimbrial subunit type 1 n=1 Tax=Corynebacterium pseudopelargi TaxID=2080757 RepID=A0A3G6IWS4_9CORY|nr:SpaH/EbpB family LPXTG-anchored major pilin [Corynebacterium pseudopelargi]AZA10231.1 Fimbrial subunit type 1 precursor [Corynebacterium pseudopelargi]